VDSSHDVLERKTVREVGGVFHSRQAIEDAIEDLLLNGFDRADIDQLASLDEVHKRFNVYVAPEELVDVPRAPRRPAFKRDDIAVAHVVTGSLLGAAAGCAATFGMLASGSGAWSAAALGVLIGLGAGAAGVLVIARAFRRDDLRGLETLQFHRGVVLWVRSRSAEREAMAQDILRRNGGRAVRVHEIDIEKRTEDLPLSKLRPDPWLGSEPLGHP